MIFCYLNLNAYAVEKAHMSFLIKLPTVKDTWLFNCSEGSQSNILQQSLKINNLSKIIIPNLHIFSVSGLLGLLSTLNLIGRIKSLHIYAPIELKYYLDLGKKYSKTNFNYVLYIHVLTTGLIVNQYGCRLYAVNYKHCYEFYVVQSEQCGTFFLNKARNNNLLPGPLYGKLKKGFSFLMPDGFTLNGYILTSSNVLGSELRCLFSSFYRKSVFESIKCSRIVLWM